MKEYHIGLDFGTCQSKACVFDIRNSTHEFIKFEKDSFFLPSRVARDNNDLFVYGGMKAGKDAEEYRYFKIAAAEDPEFHIETFKNPLGKESDYYRFTEIVNYTPEFLSVVYITYALFYIKEKYLKPKTITSEKPNLISRLFKRIDEVEETRFTVQIGIPTEWSHVKNLRRKRKFENILMISDLLQKKYLSLATFLNTPVTQITEDIKNIYNKLNFKTIDEFNLKLNELGVSVYPETAAGLTFILRTRQLSAGYYSIMDVGGGTTDVSFFRVVDDGTIRYLASESYLMAANNVYRRFYGECDTMAELREAEKKAISLIENEKWKENKNLHSALKNVDKHLEEVVYKLFNRRVYYYRKDMVSKYCNQPLILYGGGVRLPVIGSGKFKIHDNGCQSINIDHTYLEKDDITQFTSIINILPSDKSWEPDFSLLVVALGLSYIKPESSADWFNGSDYNWKDGNRPAEIAHPFNEDCYVYDVLNSHFYGDPNR